MAISLFCRHSYQKTYDRKQIGDKVWFRYYCTKCNKSKWVRV